MIAQFHLRASTCKSAWWRSTAWRRSSRAVVASRSRRWSWSGTSATAHFPQTAPGLFDLKLVSGTGSVITTTTGGALELPPALPLFNVNQVDAVSNVPGFPTTHLWNVQNRGTIDGTAVLAFGFPSYFSPEPVFIASAAPPGSRLLAHGLTSDAWIEYVAIPMQSGRSGDVAWTTVLPPAALTGPAPPTTIGAPLPFTYDLSGQFTAPEWTSVAGQAPGRIVDAAFVCSNDAHWRKGRP